MKKILMNCTSLFVIFIVFSACINFNNSSPSVAPPSLQKSDNRIHINVHYIRTNYHYEYQNSDSLSDNITLITSTRELGRYYEKYRHRIYDGNGALLPDDNFLNAIKDCTDDFFMENFLVIVRLVENSGSNRHKVETIDENGNIHIRRLLPEVGTSDMAAWSIIIELDNNSRAEQYSVVLLN